MPSPALEHSQHHGGIAAHPLTRRKRVVGLDLGTSKVAAVVGETDDFGNIGIIGVGEAPTEGLRKGVVVNIEKTVGSITAAAQAAERMAGIRFDSVVVSLAGDVEVEEASEYLFDHRIPAYPYSTEIPVDVLGAKYKWARGAGLI